MSEGDAQEHRHAMWVQTQRGRGRACLSEEVEGREGVSRSELLERLEGWAWREVEVWLGRYDGLVAWMSEHGGAWPQDRGLLGPIHAQSVLPAETSSKVTNEHSPASTRAQNANFVRIVHPNLV